MTSTVVPARDVGSGSELAKAIVLASETPKPATISFAVTGEVKLAAETVTKAPGANTYAEPWFRFSPMPFKGAPTTTVSLPIATEKPNWATAEPNHAANTCTKVPGANTYAKT